MVTTSNDYFIPKGTGNIDKRVNNNKKLKDSAKIRKHSEEGPKNSDKIPKGNGQRLWAVKRIERKKKKS